MNFTLTKWLLSFPGASCPHNSSLIFLTPGCSIQSQRQERLGYAHSVSASTKLLSLIALFASTCNLPASLIDWTPARAGIWSCFCIFSIQIKPFCGLILGSILYPLTQGGWGEGAPNHIGLDYGLEGSRESGRHSCKAASRNSWMCACSQKTLKLYQPPSEWSRRLILEPIKRSKFKWPNKTKSEDEFTPYKFKVIENSGRYLKISTLHSSKYKWILTFKNTNKKWRNDIQTSGYEKEPWKREDKVTDSPETLNRASFRNLPRMK